MCASPLLTIAIPTFNRSGCLKERLLEIQQQADERVQVLVSDNCSTDDTEAVAQTWQHKIPHLRYHKNQTNVGFDKNILTLYELAETRYIWFLSDDEHILPDAIGKVLSAVIEHEPVVAVFSFTTTDASGLSTITGVTSDIVYESLASLPEQAIVERAIFISTVVVEKNPKINTQYWAQYANSNFFHLTLALLLLAHKFRYCLMSAVVVQRQVGPPYYLQPDVLQFQYIGGYQAINVPGHPFDLGYFKRRAIRSSYLLRLLMLEKAGLYKFSQPMRRKWLKPIRAIYGWQSWRVYLFLLIYYLTPRWLVKVLYLAKMIQKHGWREGRDMYRKQTTRAEIEASH